MKAFYIKKLEKKRLDGQIEFYNKSEQHDLEEQSKNENRQIITWADFIDTDNRNELEKLRDNLLINLSVSKEHISNERRTSVWNASCENGFVEYISFEEQRIIPEKKDNKVSLFDATIELAKLSSNMVTDHITHNGVLIEKRELTIRRRSYVESYFRHLEKIKLIEGYLLPEIESMLNDVEIKKESIKLAERHRKDKDLSKKLNTEIEQMEINIISNSKYKILLDKFHINLKDEFEMDSVKSIIYKLNSNLVLRELVSVAHNTTKGNFELTLTRIKEFYEDISTEADSVILNQISLQYIDEFEEKINYILASVKAEKIPAFFKRRIDVFIESEIKNIEEILKLVDALEKFIKSNDNLTIKLKYLKDVIESAVFIRENDVKIADFNTIFYKESSKARLETILLRYVRIRTYLAIIKREDEFYRFFKELKQSIFNLMSKDHSAFSRHLTSLDEYIKRVNIDV